MVVMLPCFGGSLEESSAHVVAVVAPTPVGGDEPGVMAPVTGPSTRATTANLVKRR